MLEDVPANPVNPNAAASSARIRKASAARSMGGFVRGRRRRTIGPRHEGRRYFCDLKAE